MNIEEIKELKETLIDDEEKLLKTNTNKLIESKLMTETISPLLLSHKQFIDVALTRMIKKLKESIVQIATEKKKPVGDAIFVVKLDYLSAYILKHDIKHKNISFSTIAKFLIKQIKKDPNSLNTFVSTLKKDTYRGKNGTFKYPALYPFDRSRYHSPVPELRNLLLHAEAIVKQLKSKEIELDKVQMRLDESKKNLKQTELAFGDMKEIVAKLKDRYSEEEMKNRMYILNKEYKYFKWVIDEEKQKVTELENSVRVMKKSLDAFKEKNGEFLNKEDEVIKELATNLSKHKTKIA